MRTKLGALLGAGGLLLMAVSATVTVAAPKTVHSVINHRVNRGTDIVVQVAGGVRADLVGEIRKGDMQQEKADLKQMTQKVAPPTLPEGRWWWDAAE